MSKIPSPAEILEFEPPPPSALRARTALLRAYFNPYFQGLENLNLDRPALWVGNHTLYGFLDIPVMVEHIYSQQGAMLRGLGDRGHFQLPGWGKLLVSAGMVLGSPEHCAALMEAKQHIMVFPGGGREVMRRKGESYQLIWKQRAGFARLAIEHGYDIIPFGSVGPDDSFQILLDAKEISESRLWKLLGQRLPLDAYTRNGDMIPPLVRGVGLSALPRPQRYYFGFGERIRTSHLKHDASNPEAVWTIRERVARAVEGEITSLKAYRESDRKKHWSVLRRWLAPV